MGMGEPLDNFLNCTKFLSLVSDDNGLNIGLRHISLSTCGVVSGIDKLAELNMPITLSISLHAPFDSIRDSIMPINKRWNIKELLDACRRYQKVTTRRISFEYAMISGVNDTNECASELAKITKGIMCHINLIPANPVNENDYRKSDRAKIVRFRNILSSYGLNATVRRTLGADIDASCGQLRRKLREESLSADI
ncbi:MAG: radical SAM protein, partial [Clostridia bacterium]|nr:radical SAM protein [Clostridia bacterium]